MLIIDKVSEIENRNLYTYIFNHELGLFAGRLIGCGLFILLATYVSRVAALMFALPTIAVLQMASIWVARNTVSSAAKLRTGPIKSHPEIVEVVGR
jgi:MFS transporter, YQGE family, putative transporter